MAEVTRSPEPFHLGKRRPLDESEIEDYAPVQMAKRYKVFSRGRQDGLHQEEEGGQHQAFKRNRGDGQQLGFDGGMSSSSGIPSNQMEQYHQSVVMSLKTEHQMAMNRKEQELQHLRHEHQQLINRCQEMTKEHNACLEENRVLKRAVAIQDNKYRELSNTNQQMQQVMALAAEHVAKLEQANRELTALVHACEHGSFGGFPPGPPDVY
jgi:hypothetical protein